MTPIEVSAALWLSIKVALLATLLGLPCAIGLAWYLCQLRGWPQQALALLVNLPLVLPPVATGYILLQILGRHAFLGSALEACCGIVLAFHAGGAVLAALIMALPLMVAAVRLSFAAVAPVLDDSGKVLGASSTQRFWRIYLPLARPGILMAIGLGLLRSLGEFGATMMFAAAIPGESLTLSSAIYLLAQQPGAETLAMALCGLSIAVAAVLLLATQRLSNPSNGSQYER